MQAGIPTSGVPVSLHAPVVVDPHLHGVDDPARRAEAALTGVGQPGAAEHARFVGPVELQDLGPRPVLEGRRPGEGDRLAPGEHDPQGREVELVEQRGVEHHDELRADAGQHGDPVRHHGPQRPLDVELRRQHRRAAEHAGREVRRPQAEAEGGRHGTEEDVVGGERAGLGRQLVEVEPSVLGVQHALGQPGRARGRVDHEQVVGTQRPPGQEAGRRGRSGRLDRGSVDEDRRVREVQHVGNDDVAKPGQAVDPQRRHQVVGGLPEEVLVGDQRGRPGARQEVAQLGPAGAGADPHHHQTGLLRGQEHCVHRRPVREDHPQPVAGLEPGLDEHRGQLRRASRGTAPR